MSKGISILITLLITLGWFWFCHWWYTCGLMGACNEAPIPSLTGEMATDTTEMATESTRYALDFRLGETQPNTNTGYEALKKSVLDSMGEGKELEIVGFYYQDEESPEGYDNIGLARAEELKTLFSPPVSPEKIKLRSRLIEKPEGKNPKFLPAGEFNWKEGPRETVEELEDRIIIRFPFGSVEKEYDPAVDNYLDKLALRAKKTGEEITLTGHTDNVGEEAANKALGLKRAGAIRNILVKKGVDKSQINISSKGESQPVASNESEEGRHDNRRVELRRSAK